VVPPSATKSASSEVTLAKLSRWRTACMVRIPPDSLTSVANPGHGYELRALSSP